MDRIDLTGLFKSDKEFLIELEKVEKLSDKYKDYEGHIYDDLYNFLEYDTEISKRLERLYLYAGINSDLDLSISKYQEYVGRVGNLVNKISLLSSFVIPEVLSKDETVVKELINSNSNIKEYKLSLNNIFRTKKLSLNKEEEKIISLLTSNYDKFENTSELLINTDLDYGFIKDEKNKKVKLTNSNFTMFLESKNKRVRKDAFDSFYNEIKMHENTFGSLMSSKFSNNNKIANIRKYNDARDLALFVNNIDTKIYDNLIEGVHKNLKTFYKYYDLKKEILNLKEIHIYDTHANICKKYDKKYEYTEAKDLVLKSLAPLGDKYVSDLKRAFDENWIDVYPSKGKRDGGYCTCAYLSHPYLVINYEKKLNDVSTLAHELGHAMHYLYAMQNNKYQDYNYSIFVAEVASQVNEILLTDYLYKNSNSLEEKKYLLDLMLSRFKSTIIRQTMFAEFEDKMHKDENKGIILTKDYLEDEYLKLNKLYFGKNVFVDDKIKYECFRIPHFYYNFYVYQYATGYTAASLIASRILSGNKETLDNYLKFLKLGSTKDPVKSLLVAGIDINDDSIYKELFKIFENRLNELRSLYE